MKKGFTLIELSIVLVIIGLFIGGILAAQSMVASTKLNAFVRQIGQYDIAVINFRNKYGYLPGDSPLHNPVGDGDGKIYDDLANSDVNDTLRGDMMNFWIHLRDTEIPNIVKWSVPINVVMAGLNVPGSKIGVNAVIVAGTQDTNVNAVFPFGTHLYSVTKQVASGYSIYSSDITQLTVPEALSVDTKMDDGIANAGIVRATNGERLGILPTIRNSGCVQSDVSLYETASDARATNCGISVQMISKLGQSD